ncbi:hypothetical protein H4R20_006333, partial [Coemansia guatemalensis]
ASKNSEPISLDMLNKINPGAASSTFCSDFEKNTGIKGECILNSNAVEPINKAIAKYRVKSFGEVAAILAWMLFESNGWQYVVNHYPGNKGQGTRAMITWEDVSKYAKELHPIEYTGLM